MREPLDSLPNGSDVLIDANVFIYALSAKSNQCKAFLERCSREEITGITLFEIVHEVTHRLMIAEAAEKGLFAGQEKGGKAKFLSRNPAQVKLLTDYWVGTLRLLALNVIFLQMEQDIVEAAQTERVNVGLLTNDSVIAAAMKEYGITKIATNDRQFEAVRDISVFAPTDVVA